MASPINDLLAIGQIEVRPRMFGTIVIASSVMSEFQPAEAPAANLRWLAKLPAGFQIRSATRLDPSLDLDAGEREAIRLAEELSAAAVLADEKKGRAFRRQQQLAEMKGDFVSGVSHELRAPIASVRMMSEELEDIGPMEPAKSQEYDRLIKQECRRLSSLIENVLDFSRHDQGRKEYVLEPTDMAALVEEAVKVTQPCGLERGMTLTTAHRESPLPSALQNLPDLHGANMPPRSPPVNVSNVQAQRARANEDGFANRDAIAGFAGALGWALFIVVEFMKLRDNPDKHLPFGSEGVNCSGRCLIIFLLVQ